MMREGVQTFVFMILLIIAPIMLFDLFLNNGQWWHILAKHTLIDEIFKSIPRFFLI